MDSTTPAFAFFAVLGFFGLLAYIFYRIEKKRTEKLGAVAQQIGMQFIGKDPDKTYRHTVGLFRLGQQGNTRRAKNIMVGKAADLTTTILDYFYQIGSGKNSSRYHQTVLMFEQEGIDVPEFILRPEHFGDRMKQALGKDDIDFDEHPLFSKKYYLQGTDEARIRAWFTPARREYFENNQGWYIEGHPGRLLICLQRRRKQPEDMVSFLQEGLQIKEVLIN